MSTSPPLGCSRPAMSRSRVVLPHPDGPSRTRYSPSSVTRSIPSTAVVCPKSLRSDLVSTTAIGSPPVPVVWAHGCSHTRPLARHLLKMASHCFAADATACFGVAFPWATLAIMVGRTLVVKISPSAAFAAPGYPTFVVHCSVLAKAGKSYSSELYTASCAAPTRSSRNCLILSTFVAHLGTI